MSQRRQYLNETPKMKDTMKQKLVIEFLVEMSPQDAMSCAIKLDAVRHTLNEEHHWDISRDMPTFRVKERGQ